MKRAKLDTSGPPGIAASYATSFSAAITRMPADTASDGLRAEETGAIDIELMAKQHEQIKQEQISYGAFSTTTATLCEF